MRLLLSLLFLIPLQVRAEWTQEQCPDLDFSAQMGPVRNQTTVEQCYAFVAADLIGFNQGLGPEQRVSAFDVTTQYLSLDPEKIRTAPGKRDPARFFRAAVGNSFFMENRKQMDGTPLMARFARGGDVAMAVEAYNFRSGLCTEKKLPSEGRWSFMEGFYFFQNQVGRLLGWGIDFDSPIFPAGNSPSSPLVAGVQSMKKPLENPCAPPDALEKIAAFQRDLNNQSVHSLNEAVNRACEPRKPLKPMSAALKIFTPEEKPGISDFLMKSLKQGVPVGVGYDSSFLRNGASSPVLPGNHVSSVVGSHWNSESHQCEFKIRNSWGFSCDIYHESLRAQCDKGNIWVNADDLAARVEVAYWIQPPPSAK